MKDLQYSLKMKPLNKNKSTFFILALSLSVGLSFCYAEVIDKILVVVNDEVITQREVDRKIAPIYMQLKSTYGDSEFEEKFRKSYASILEQLVNDKLVVSEAKRRGVEITDEEVQGELEKVKSRFKSDEEFYLTLEGQGVSVNELKENYRASLMAKELIDNQIGSKIAVTPIEIVNYYNENKELFTDPEMVKTYSILIKIKNDRGSEDSLKLANTLFKQLKKGAAFSLLAEKYSDGVRASSGGDMGYVKKGEMIERIDEVLFSLKKDEFSDVIRTDLGFHIYKVADKLAPRLKPFATVKNETEKLLFNQKIQEKLKAYISKLRQNAYIAYK